MPRISFHLAAASALLLLTVPVVAADHPGTCPAYTHRADAAGVDLAFNEQGQAFVSAFGTFYVTNDYTFGVTGTEYLFSIWIYQESNGRDGLQRNDGFCNSTHDGEESDIGCIC